MLQREYFRRELEREWERIESEEKKLDEEKKNVVAEWVAVEELQQEYNNKRAQFESIVSKRFNFLPADDIVAFNVGGQLYKSTVKVWTRDRFSILAQLCTTKPKLAPIDSNSTGGLPVFFFDRDFWIFQFIYAFLRDNTLPDHVEILRELYYEASFYRIGLLRHAIESKMIGEDAMATSLLSTSRRSSVSSVQPIPTAGVASSPSLPKKENASTAKNEETVALSPPSASTDNKYGELPDPFGFTSKKI